MKKWRNLPGQEDFQSLCDKARLGCQRGVRVTWSRVRVNNRYRRKKKVGDIKRKRRIGQAEIFRLHNISPSFSIARSNSSYLHLSSTSPFNMMLVKLVTSLLLVTSSIFAGAYPGPETEATQPDITKVANLEPRAGSYFSHFDVCTANNEGE
jgi:hypothetical protein